MEKQAWLEQGRALAATHKAHQWEIADWLLAGEELAPTDLYNLAEEIFPQYSRATFRVWVSVARAWPNVMRITQLTFTHHQAVMAATATTVGTGEFGVTGLSKVQKWCSSNEEAATWSKAETEKATAALRKEWLAKAVANNWSVAALRLAMQKPKLAPVVTIPIAATEELPLEAEPPAPTPVRPAPMPVEARDYALPLSGPQRERLALLAEWRGVPAATLAAHAVEEYLADYADEVAAAEEAAAARSKQAMGRNGRLHAAAKAMLGKATAKRAEDIAAAKELAGVAWQ